jgi:hypothetical protein
MTPAQNKCYFAKKTSTFCFFTTEVPASEIKISIFPVEREAGRALARAPAGPPRLHHRRSSSRSSSFRPSRPPAGLPLELPPAFRLHRSSFRPSRPRALELLPASRPRSCLASLVPSSSFRPAALELAPSITDLDAPSPRSSSCRLIPAL